MKWKRFISELFGVVPEQVQGANSKFAGEIRESSSLSYPILTKD